MQIYIYILYHIVADEHLLVVAFIYEYMVSFNTSKSITKIDHNETCCVGFVSYCSI